MPIAEFRLTRFQFRRDRVIGDCQVKIDQACLAALELIDEKGRTGLGFMTSLFHPLPDVDEIRRVFAEEIWPGLEGQPAASLLHRVTKPRGGNRRSPSLPFGEAIQQALWDLHAKELDLPLWRLLGGTRRKVRAYASGLDFHLPDAEFTAFFGRADALGYSAFKIKVGHPDVAWDLHRLGLLKAAVRRDAVIMVDANEAWSAKEAAMRVAAYRRAGHDLLWVEDPLPRDDFDGLNLLRSLIPDTQVNAGEYLDTAGKLGLMAAGGADIVNVHGLVTDVMHIGRVAASRNIPLALGNTVLELGVNLALALPDTEWLEYSFQNLDHLVDEPVTIKDGFAWGSDRPGHGLVLSEAARTRHAAPRVLTPDEVRLPAL